MFISEDIHYYPNPTNNDVKVHVGGKDQKVKISVFTTAGALVYTQEQTIEDMTRKTQIDLSKQYCFKPRTDLSHLAVVLFPIHLLQIILEQILLPIKLTTEQLTHKLKLFL